MLEPIQKWIYRVKANVPGAKEQLDARLADRLKLSLKGLHGERLCLTGYQTLVERAAILRAMYEDTPVHRSVRDIILLDAFNSATIEGARTTVAQVKQSADHPITKDDKMVVNTIKGSNYAFRTPITEKNIRHLWETVVAGVCENEFCRGRLYRDGMVYIGNASRTVHTPAAPEQLPQLMENLFRFCQEPEPEMLIRSFVAHFYFVYVHPFCDGNGRTARILNTSLLYHGGYEKIRNLSLSSAINRELSGYYSSMTNSELVLSENGTPWLDLSPFVSYMLDAFERCLIDAALSRNVLTGHETLLLTRMNKVGVGAEITSEKAAKILGNSRDAARRTLRNLVNKGYLTVDEQHVPYVYRLQQHIPET